MNLNPEESESEKETQQQENVNMMETTDKSDIEMEILKSLTNNLKR